MRATDVPVRGSVNGLLLALADREALEMSMYIPDRRTDEQAFS
jgi:hypothetical protein